MVRLRVEGEKGELESKGADIVKAMVESLPSADFTTEILEVLEKASPVKEQQLKHPAMRALHLEMKAIVDEQYEAMHKEIGKVLDRKPEAIKKAFDHSKKYFDADAKKYDEVKSALSEHGYETHDFEIGGDLYGWSTNQLIDLYKQLQRMEKSPVKASKEAAGYGNSSGQRSCSECRFFERGESKQCMKVEGEILPEMTCRFWRDESDGKGG